MSLLCIYNSFGKVMRKDHKKFYDRNRVFLYRIDFKGLVLDSTIREYIMFFVIHKTVLGGCDLVSANTQADLKIPYHKNNNNK